MNDHEYVHGGDSDVKMDGSTIYIEEWVDTHDDEDEEYDDVNY